MKMVTLLLMVMSMTGCDLQASVPLPKQAKFWTVKEFVIGNRPSGGFGGFFKEDLISDEGGKTPFSDTGVPEALVVRPAFSQNKPAAYAITEIWANHENPWLQPVYLLPVVNGKRQGGVFPTDVNSTFYSPFWRAEVLQTDEPPRYLTSALKFLNAKGELVKDMLIYCPIVPETFSGKFSSDTHPQTQEALWQFPTDADNPNGNRAGFVDDIGIHYLAITGERFAVAGKADQDLVEEKIYFFIDDQGSLLKNQPAILSDDAIHHSFVRRYDVLLTAQTSVIRSAQEIESLPVQLIQRTEVTMAIVVLLANGETRP